MPYHIGVDIVMDAAARWFVFIVIANQPFAKGWFAMTFSWSPRRLKPTFEVESTHTL